MEKLTFKEYLASKDKLREAITQTPVRKAEYVMRKYCKLPVGESKDEKEFIALKPKHRLIVEWHYTDLNNPELVSICFEDVNGVSPDDKYASYWSDERFKKWLFRNTREL
jgi:hypothetical protein